MTWFDTLTGFSETSGDDVRSKLRLEGSLLKSLENNQTFDCGEFTTPSLNDLRQNSDLSESEGCNIRVSEVVADVQSLHQDPANSFAVFQVASQFNCLEMAAPHITSEKGVGIYQNDWTQAPLVASVQARALSIETTSSIITGNLGNRLTTKLIAWP